jgi:hypothetical protein
METTERLGGTVAERCEDAGLERPECAVVPAAYTCSSGVHRRALAHARSTGQAHPCADARLIMIAVSQYRWFTDPFRRTTGKQLK